MGRITLKGMEFYAYHGFYEEERKVGNKYNVDIEVKARLQEAAATDKLSHTVNYEQLYKIVAAEMAQPSKLLEHVAMRIAEKAAAAFPSIKQMKVHVSKYNPPVGGVCYAASVTYKYKKA